MPANAIAAVAASGVTAGEALKGARERIGSDPYRAWVQLVNDDGLPAQAVARPAAARPLAGVTIGVKDIIDLAGLPTRCGSDIIPETPAPRSASLVNRLAELGVIAVGKTVTTEFAYFRPGPTGNPRNPAHTPGGSSSGSAAAVAAGHVPLALGSQTAGSVTRPAAYCGVASLVVTHGSVALDGFSGLAPSLDTAGLLAQSVADLRYVYQAMTGGSAEAAVGTVYAWGGGGLDDVSGAMSHAVRDAVGSMRQLGATIRSLPADVDVAALAADHAVVMAHETTRSRVDLFQARHRLGAQLRELLETGAAISESEYQAAAGRARQARERIAELLTDGAVILGPAAPGAAPAGLGATGSPVMSRPWQLLGLPQLCVPGAVDAGGLPLGVQLVGGPAAEAALLATGEALERTPRAAS